MKRRMVDGGIWANEKFAELPCTARLLQIGLVTLADDQGRIKAHPSYLRSQLFPYDEDVSVGDIRKWLTAIVSNGTAIVYEVDGKEYIQLVNWWDYQSLQYAAPSDMPRPQGWQDRIRYNAKGGMTLTCNWTTPSGEMPADTCNAEGDPLPIVATLPPRNPGGRPPKNPPENPGENPPGNTNKDQYKNNLNKDQAAEAPTPAAAAEPTDVQRVWIAWDANMPGTKTPVIVDGVNSWLDDYSIAEIEEAISIACKRNKRNFSYIDGILRKGAFTEKPPPLAGDYPTQHRTQNRGRNAAAAYMARKGMFNGPA